LPFEIIEIILWEGIQLDCFFIIIPLGFVKEKITLFSKKLSIPQERSGFELACIKEKVKKLK